MQSVRSRVLGVVAGLGLAIGLVSTTYAAHNTTGTLAVVYQDPSVITLLATWSGVPSSASVSVQLDCPDQGWGAAEWAADPGDKDSGETFSFQTNNFSPPIPSGASCTAYLLDYPKGRQAEVLASVSVST